MIPWFVVNIIGAVASLFGRETYVAATSGNWLGADRVYFIRRAPGAQRLKRLRPYRGGEFAPTDVSRERQAIAAHVGAETMATLGPS